MSDAPSLKPPTGPLTTERRQDVRYPVRPTEYIEIGDSNGGIILDISQSGMAVASAQALVGNQTLRFRFQLPRSLDTIETSGEINWIGDTKKRAGVRFVDLPAAAREQIRQWIDAQTSGQVNGEQPHSIPGGASSSIVPANGVNSSKIATSPSSPFISPLDGPEIEDSENTARTFDREESGGSKTQAAERRARTRRALTASTYVQLNDGNGGLMGNLSETGFSVRAAKTLETDHLPLVRFQLPDSSDFIESAAWIVWKSASKKTAGVRFETLPEEARAQIAEWVEAQAPQKNGKEKHAPDSSAGKFSAPVTFLAPDSVPVPAYISSPAQKSVTPPVQAPAPTTKSPALFSSSLRPPPSSAAQKVVTPGIHVPREPKNWLDQNPARPVPSSSMPPGIPVLPPVHGETDWYIAPRKPLGLWKIAAIVVVIVGVLSSVAVLVFRDKQKAAPAPQSVAQNSSIAAGAPAVNNSPGTVADSSLAKRPATSSSTATPVAESSPRASDARENPFPPQNDAQFVDQPRASSSQAAQISKPPSRDDRSSSRVASSQPFSEPTPVRNSERNPIAVTANRPAQVDSTADSTTFKDVAPPRVLNESPASTPSSVASRNQEVNSAPASTTNVPQNAPAPVQPVTSTQNNGATSSVTPRSDTAFPAAVSPNSAAVQNLVGSVSFFSRFRAIRASAGSAHPDNAGAELQIGRLMSSPAPAYPSDALRQQIQGLVELEVLVGSEGDVQSVHLVRGPGELASVAMGAVRGWHYGQTMLGGHPVETSQSVFFTFKLGK